MQVKQSQVKQSKKKALLDAVKTTVAKYGLVDLSTRKLADTAEINGGLIYHYYRDKEDLLLQAYKQENEAIFTAMMSYIDENHDIPFSFHDKARLSFHRSWRELLSDPDRLTFCSSYYHSIYFKSAREFHDKQVLILIEKLGGYFDEEAVCVQTMYALLTILYDSAKSVIEGMSEDTPETEELIFSICYGLLLSQIKKGEADQ